MPKPNWRGHSDTETLLAAFAAWGVMAALQKAVGMFALALWDRRERVLHLARDSGIVLGAQPLTAVSEDSAVVRGIPGAEQTDDAGRAWLSPGRHPDQG